MGEVIKLRKDGLAVSCECQPKNTFHVFIDDRESVAIVGIECAECGRYYRIPKKKV